MSSADASATQFERYRPRLRAVARRLLGSEADAELAVHQAWVQLSSHRSEIENVPDWLLRVLGRTSLDMLRIRAADPDRSSGAAAGAAPMFVDGVGVALGPVERVSLVLHDVVGMPFGELAQVLGSSAATARQQARRARRRLRGAEPASARERADQLESVARCLVAARTADSAEMQRLLGRDVVLRADPSAVAAGVPALVRGVPAVSEELAAWCDGAELVLADGEPAARCAPADTPARLIDFVTNGRRLMAVEVLADPDLLAQVRIEPVA